MESDKSSSTRKLRFTPKLPAQRKNKKPAVPQTSKDGDDINAEDRETLLQRFSGRGIRQQRSEVEKEAPVQATFTHVTKRGSDDPQDGGLKLGRESDLMDLDDSNNHNQSVSSLSAVGSSEVEESQEYESDSEAEYIDPWNAHTYYPTILPLRRPNSGDPDILDAAEFGESAANLEHIEEIKSAASKFGMLNLDEIKGEPKLIFLQFPKSVPAIKQSATAKGKETEGILGPLGQKGSVAMKVGESSTADTSQETRSLEEMRAGHMGKLEVYKSGKAKLKLGETQFDVTAGSDCSFAQEVVALNTKEKECYSIGKLDNRAIVTPDIGDILKSNENDLG